MNDNEYTVIKLVAEHFQLKMVEVEPHMDLFDDLGADSLDSVELVLEIEKIFDVEVADEMIDSTRTVQDIITMVNDLS